MSQENVELVTEGVARWRAGDNVLLEFLVSVSAPDVELYSRFAGMSGEPYRGHRGMRAWLADIHENFDRFEPWLDETRAVGDDRVLALGGISFRGKESGIDMAEQMGWVFEFRKGLLRRMMFYGSSSEALEAVGLSK
jgi:ketosteroid isomerase-like protein